MPKSRRGGDQGTGPRRGRWSAEEVARFKDLYGLRDETAIARELNRSIASVRNMAKTVFVKGSRSGPWSAAEIRKLKQYLGRATNEQIAVILGRSKDSVQEQIVDLSRVQRSGPWTPAEINEFKRMYGTRTDEDLALVFGRSLDTIRDKAADLCIAKDKAFLRKHSGGKQATRMPRWTEGELDLLRRWYPSHSNLDIAQKLSRSVKSIVSKAHNMGLRKDPSRLREMGRQNVSLRYGKRETR